eukprot:6172543-Pleurochrysis_carterae.AAC.1
MRGLTDRAKANQHRQERTEETRRNKRIRLANEENGTRTRVLEQPEQRPEGGEWELPPHDADIAARRLLGGQDGRGIHRVFKEEAMDLAHEEREGVAHMKAASGKKLTYDTLNVAMSLHERYPFHLAVATDGAKRGGTKDRSEMHKLSETTYGVWQRPDSAEILRNKRKKASALQKRLGVPLDQTDKARAVEQGFFKGQD